MGYTDQFSFNGSNVDFGSQINTIDWYKKQQAAKMQPWDQRAKQQLQKDIGIDKVFEDTNKRLEQLKPKLNSLKTDTNSAVGNPNFGVKLKNFAGSYGGVIGDAASAIGNMIGKRGMDGKYGGITKGMDAAYDTVQKAAAQFGPVGQMVSGIMGAGKLLGNAVSKIGGGTDGMTKTDAIMNSAFLNLTPLGLINGFGGATANTYTRNQELDKSTNGGFQGFLSTQDITGIGAGKKYGLFSRGAMNKQNQLTEFTTNMKHTVSGIVDTNTINNLAAQGSTPFLAQQQSMDLNGGIQQMQAARQGMRFTRRVVHKYGFGSWIKNLFKSNDPKSKESMDQRFGYNQQYPKQQENFNVMSNKQFVEDNEQFMKDLEDRQKERQVNYDEITKNALDKSDSRIQNKQSVTRLSSNAIGPTLNTNIISDPNLTVNNTSTDVQTQPVQQTQNDQQDNNTQNLTGYTPTWQTTPISSNIPGYTRKKIKSIVSSYQQGSKLKRTFKTVDVATGKYVEIPRDLDKDQIKGRKPIRLTNGTAVFMNSDGTVTSDRWETVGEREHLTPKGEDGLKLPNWMFYDDGTGNIYQFKQGGQMNVIPEGALHARLNHIKDVDEDLAKQITHKGIPVITVEKDGEVVQHAEIEHSEIIFTLDVTNKLEDLRKKWHQEEKDEYAIEAGKLLVKEILHNTDDRTNLIASIE